MNRFDFLKTFGLCSFDLFISFYVNCLKLRLCVNDHRQESELSLLTNPDNPNENECIEKYFCVLVENI